MSRTLTTRNYQHPHYRFKAFQEETRKRYRTLSAVQLAEAAKTNGVDPSMPRHQVLETLVRLGCIHWKEKWKENMGWDFDDVYDERKFAEHVKTETKKRAENQAELAKRRDEAIDHRLLFDGEQITKEEFNMLLPEVQKAVQEDLEKRIKTIVGSGFGGTLQNGMIVDRRLFPTATPLRANELLSIPEPVFA